MPTGFMSLVAILDWFSRFVLTWQLSNTLDGLFCVDALQRALQQGHPDIFNTDQGVQFTSTGFTGELEAAHIRISRDGRGRAFDYYFRIISSLTGAVFQMVPVTANVFRSDRTPLI